MSVRIAYDPALPVFATEEISCGGRKFVQNDAFPWRELGLSEFELLAFWRSGLVYFTAAADVVVVEKPETVPHKNRKRQQQPAG